MRAKAVIVNYTGESGHWGMLGTSLALVDALVDRGYDVATIGVLDIAGTISKQRAGSPAAENWQTDIAETLWSRFDDAALVVVNGEGTLHGVRPSSLNLLALIKRAATGLGKPVHVVNFSCFPQSISLSIGSSGEPYRAAFEALKADRDRVVVREELSGEILVEMGIAHRVGFDCLPLTLERYFPALSYTPGNRIVLSGGAGYSRKALCTFAGQVATAVPNVDEIVYLSGGHPAFAAFERDTVFPSIAAGEPQTRLHLAQGLGEFLRFLAAGTAVLITGRFHYAIAAACLGVPTVLLHSNSLKNVALAQLAGLNAPLSPENLGEPELLSRAASIAIETAEWRLPKLAERARENFRDLPGHDIQTAVNATTQNMCDALRLGLA